MTSFFWNFRCQSISFLCQVSNTSLFTIFSDKFESKGFDQKFRNKSNPFLVFYSKGQGRENNSKFSRQHLNNGNSRTMCEICSKLAIKRAEQCQGHPSQGHFHALLASTVFLTKFEFKQKVERHF